ncbi:MAG: DUF1887 family protein, partial [Pseudomonadales bacterium]|nr:DUF1887 family protein [Pseudomonadales bacterium]
RDLCQKLVLNVVDWEAALGQLNAIASEAERLGQPVVNVADVVSHPAIFFDALVRECFNAGLLKTDSPRQVEFIDESARNFCNGGWIEFYVNSRLNELKSEALLQDSPHLNIKIRRSGSKKESDNEIDVAFMANNRLHIIECKTKKMKGIHAGKAGVETLYKLDSISDLGGLGTKAMLVSYRNLRPADRQRAKDLRIHIIEGKDIQQLKTKLREWIKN